MQEGGYRHGCQGIKRGAAVGARPAAADELFYNEGVHTVGIDRVIEQASAESHPGDPAEQAAESYRRWVRDLLTELAAQAGVSEPGALARQLHLLYDGSGQSARMDHDPAAAAAARAAAATLLDAALAHGTATPLSR